MSRIAYVNGAYVPRAFASVHIEDRGYQFADGVYEVWAVRGARMLDSEGHFARLSRSLRELQIPMPMEHAALAVALRETLRQNHVRDGMLYLQITRGQAPRDHAFPLHVSPSVVITARAIDLKAQARRIGEGVRVLTTPEIRWARCDIKSTALLPNVLAKQKAKEAGAYEAWFIDKDGFITEGSSTNAWIATREGVLVTRDLNANILHGVTRAALIGIAHALQMRVEERAFTLAEAQGAAEAFLSSASGAAMPVVAIDGAPVGSGKPGPIAARLREAYLLGAGAKV